MTLHDVWGEPGVASRALYHLQMLHNSHIVLGYAAVGGTSLLGRAAACRLMVAFGLDPSLVGDFVLVPTRGHYLAEWI